VSSNRNGDGKVRRLAPPRIEINVVTLRGSFYSSLLDSSSATIESVLIVVLPMGRGIEIGGSKR